MILTAVVSAEFRAICVLVLDVGQQGDVGQCKILKRQWHWGKFYSTPVTVENVGILLYRFTDFAFMMYFGGNI